MKTLEEQIQVEYYRLSAKLGCYPSYLHVHPSFVNKMISTYSIYGLLQIDDYYLLQTNENKKIYKYMGMFIKRSLDINEDEFILSFNKYQL